jgi:hypothetical protein
MFVVVELALLLLLFESECFYSFSPSDFPASTVLNRNSPHTYPTFPQFRFQVHVLLRIIRKLYNNNVLKISFQNFGLLDQRAFLAESTLTL